MNQPALGMTENSVHRLWQQSVRVTALPRPPCNVKCLLCHVWLTTVAWTPVGGCCQAVTASRTAAARCLTGSCSRQSCTGDSSAADSAVVTCPRHHTTTDTRRWQRHKQVKSFEDERSPVSIRPNTISPVRLCHQSSIRPCPNTHQH